MKRLLDLPNAVEIYTAAMLVIYSVLFVIFWGQIDIAFIQMTKYIGIFVLMCIFAHFSTVSKNIAVARKFYLIPFVLFVYNQVHIFIPHINPYEFDELFIKMDRMLFGVNPTEWIYRFSHPLLTEYLQFCYMTFFFMPIAQGVELHLRGKDEEFGKLIRMILFGFYVSYLLYFFFPAIGPRFCVHDFLSLSNELPGLWLADTFRNFINTGGGIPPGVLNPQDYVNRDCMPSGHTMLTLMNIYLSFKFKSRLRYVFLIIGSSLIFSTVYLRYHYVVDLIAGLIFAVLVLWSEPYIYAWLKKKFFPNA